MNCAMLPHEFGREPGGRSREIFPNMNGINPELAGVLVRQARRDSGPPAPGASPLGAPPALPGWQEQFDSSGIATSARPEGGEKTPHPPPCGPPSPLGEGKESVGGDGAPKTFSFSPGEKVAEVRSRMRGCLAAPWRGQTHKAPGFAGGYLQGGGLDRDAANFRLTRLVSNGV